MSKTLDMLAEEYDEAIALMKECCEKVKAERKHAKSINDTYRYKYLSSELLVIYGEIRDMRLIADALRNYYKDSNGEVNCA